MRNAKQELLKEVNPSHIKCAEIECNGRNILMKVGGDVTKFIESLDFNYDAGYGGQELFGKVWLTDDKSWLERGEYDGAEWWNLKRTPIIPNKLR